jgi:capsular polysaccharide biosynthesis protein/MinD-like ATPase involved in chromosome partitioning or flagellar assembly
MLTYVRFLKRHLWLLVLVTACALAATAFVTFRKDPVYRATMKVVVAQTGGTSQPDIGSQKLSQTMSNLLESDVVATSVIRRLSLDTTPHTLLKELHVSFKPDSSVLEITFDSTDKRSAVIVLREFSRAFQRLVDEKLGVQSGRGALGDPGTLPVIIATVFDPPHLKPGRVSPKPARTLGFAGVLGLAAALMLAFARESLDAGIRDRGDAEKWFGAPVLGSLPKGAVGRPPPEVGGRENRDLVEAMRVLSANLQFSESGVRGPTVLVTSAQKSEGKTTVAANLAVELAMSGKDVICVDADMRRPRLHAQLLLGEDGRGLVDVIRGSSELDDALEVVNLVVPSRNGRPLFRRRAPQDIDTVTVTTEGRLRALRAGRTEPGSASIFTKEVTRDLVETLSSMADYVVVDAPPLLALADAFPLALQADSVLVVARLDRTTKERAGAVRTTLDGLGVRSVAVVLTDAPVREGYHYSG